VADALIGSTGFIGGNLARQHRFDDCYSSTNIESIGGRHYQLIACAGAPGRKWLANREPQADRQSIDRLIHALERAEAEQVVLISTVDVYPVPVGVDEGSAIDNSRNEPYGQHRRLLEEFVQARFDATVLRLPALFGPGLKKNVVYDFLHGNRVELIHPASTFQFYDLGELWRDIARVREAGIALVNFATEPVSVREIARDVFGFQFENPGNPLEVHYDFRTRYAQQLGGRGHYLRDKAAVLEAMGRFVGEERAR
jgi:nucleoside-diphosphate-sugar epimerase